MAAVGGGVTLAAITSRENISKKEAKEMMDDLVSEGVLKKEKRNGETVYTALSSNVKPIEPQQKIEPSPASQAAKFCTNCGAKILSDSKFCGQCGTRLET